MTTYMTNAEWRSWRTKLTRAQNKRDHERVLQLCAEFFALELEGVALPDDWSRFARARRDAQGALVRSADR